MSSSALSAEVFGITLGRWFNIGLRTLHLIGIMGLGGAILFDPNLANWSNYQILALGTGVGLLIIEMWRSKYFICELRGIAITTKLILLALTYYYPDYTEELFWAVITIAGVFSHVPGKIRHHSIFHGRRMDSK